MGLFHPSDPFIFGHLFRGYPCPSFCNDRLVYAHLVENYGGSESLENGKELVEIAFFHFFSEPPSPPL